MNKDMLKILMDKQMKLDLRIGGITRFNKMEFLGLTATAMSVEVGEYMNEIKHFKHWSKNVPTEINKQMEEELIDALHFMLSSLNQVFGTPERVVEAYTEKNLINYERQETNY